MNLKQGFKEAKTPTPPLLLHFSIHTKMRSILLQFLALENTSIIAEVYFLTFSYSVFLDYKFLCCLFAGGGGGEFACIVYCKETEFIETGII